MFATSVASGLANAVWICLKIVARETGKREIHVCIPEPIWYFYVLCYWRFWSSCAPKQWIQPKEYGCKRGISVRVWDARTRRGEDGRGQVAVGRLRRVAEREQQQQQQRVQAEQEARARPDCLRLRHLRVPGRRHAVTLLRVPVEAHGEQRSSRRQSGPDWRRDSDAAAGDDVYE